MSPDRKLLTIRGAARRVKRGKATIERWIAEDGLATINVVNDAGTVTKRYVLEDELLAIFRTKLAANLARKNNLESPPR